MGVRYRNRRKERCSPGYRRDLLKANSARAAVRPAMPKAAEIPTVGDAAQLFIDFDQVDLVDNVVRTFHQAEKHPHNPVLGKEKPWEHDRGTWGSVIYGDRWRACLKDMVRWPIGTNNPKSRWPAQCDVLRDLSRRRPLGPSEPGAL